jgi:hypothetical protein
MAERAEVEAFLRKAYAARQREKLDEIAELFHPAACFSVLGEMSRRRGPTSADP